MKFSQTYTSFDELLIDVDRVETFYKDHFMLVESTIYPETLTVEYYVQVCYQR